MMIRVQDLFRKLRIGQPRRPEVLHDNREKTGRRGKVEETIAGGAPFPIEPIQQGLQLLVSRWVAEVVGDVVDALAEAFHKRVAFGRELQILLNCLCHLLPKTIVRGRRASTPNDRKSGRQHALTR